MRPSALPPGRGRGQAPTPSGGRASVRRVSPAPSFLGAPPPRRSFVAPPPRCGRPVWRPLCYALPSASVPSPPPLCPPLRLPAIPSASVPSPPPPGARTIPPSPHPPPDPRPPSGEKSGWVIVPRLAHTPPRALNPHPHRGAPVWVARTTPLRGTLRRRSCYPYRRAPAREGRAVEPCLSATPPRSHH